MTAVRRVLIAVVVLACPAAAGAQTADWSPEVSMAAGLGHVFRFSDQTFGDRANIGGGVAIVHASRIALALEVDRTLGLRPRQAPCGIVGVVCAGIGHDGPRSALVTSLTFHYRFGQGRIQPYVLGGLGVLWSSSLHSLTQVRGSQAIVTESESRDRGFGPDLGAGLRIALGGRASVAPEIRWLDAPWLSRENLAVTRILLRASYAW